MPKTRREIAREVDEILLSTTPKLAGGAAPRHVTVHEVLAGAYRGKRARLDAMLTHASNDGGSTAVGVSVAGGNLCDVQLPNPPTCKRCNQKYQ